jgi:DNA topoisomerase VI subunit B
MNGIQIQHVLSLLEEKSAYKNRILLRQELVKYLELHMDDVAKDLTTKGEATIPTSLGGIKLTTKDLEMVAA